MRIHVLTLFPEIFEGPLRTSVVGRAVRNGVLEITLRQLREFAADRHGIVDDQAYGGGPGMVLKPEPIFAAVEDIVAREKERAPDHRPHVVLLSPQGRLFNDAVAREIAGHQSLILICGRYEGVDERVVDHLADDEISIGDYVLTGGELPALVIIDAVSRYVPGVLGSVDSARRDSLSVELEGLLQGPVYTRPAEFRGWRVPEVLLSGDHEAIAAWRREQALKRTRERRPDLPREGPRAGGQGPGDA